MRKVMAEVRGSVWEIVAQPGQQVNQGDVLLIVESMKMEIPVEAPASGTVEDIRVTKGDTIEDGEWIATLV